ncbi:MAG: methyltransferase domain-containing protein [Cyanobacteria bacterium SBLK]|nr:methyltransferase domain-containing protein [Cyanobacteria bacterium SBLK]
MSDRVTEHYRNLSNNYDELWSYSPEFIAAMAQAICDRLQAKTSDRIVDLGGGTGLYTKAIDRLLQPDNKITCVDPSSEMLDRVNSERIETCCQDAVIFTEEPGNYNKVLLKEAIHHIPEKARLFENLYRQLPTGGIFLLILLPPTIEYPLFTAALQHYEKSQPNYQDLVAQLETANFKVETAFVDFPAAIDRDRYLNMVKMRYMSLFRHFSDGEIAAGIEEIKEKYPDTILTFNDRFVFITASK